MTADTTTGESPADATNQQTNGVIESEFAEQHAVDLSSDHPRVSAVTAAVFTRKLRWAKGALDRPA